LPSSRPIIRKLSEAKKLSDELEAAVISVIAYPAWSDYRLDFLSAHHVEKGYDLASPRKKSLGPKRLCNLLVHSFVFVPTSDEQGTTCTGFFLNSDRTKTKEVLFITWEDFDLLVDEVVGDHIVTMSVDRIRDRVTKSRVADGVCSSLSR